MMSLIFLLLFSLLKFLLPAFVLILSLLELLGKSRLLLCWFVFLGEILVTFRPGIDSSHLFSKYFECLLSGKHGGKP